MGAVTHICISALFQRYTEAKQMQFTAATRAGDVTGMDEARAVAAIASSSWHFLL